MDQQPVTFAPEFFRTEQDIHRIEFDGGAWVEIRRSVTIGERDSLTKKCRQTKTRSLVDPKTRKGRIESYIDFDEAEWTIGFLTLIVVKWSSVEPITRDTIQKLPEPVFARINKEFAKLNPQLDEEDENGLGLSENEFDSPSNGAGSSQSDWDSFPK